MSATSSQISHLDATAQAELVSSGEVTQAELIEGAITRAEAVNPELNAIIHPLFDEAREAAAGELPDGPFRGVPFLLKDLGASLAGQPYHAGNRLLKEIGMRHPLDTALALRFKSAGLVTIGKTNTPEWGILPTAEPVAYGATHNPWDTTRGPGGSSGGSGAAVAAGIVPIAHANDGGGSIRIPASVNGLVGLKPSRARVSEAPLAGDTMSGLVAEFVVAKSIRDVGTMLDWVSGPEPGDPYGAPPPERPYAEEVGRDPGKLRIALLTDPLTGDVPNPVVIEAAEGAAGRMEALGHEISRPEPPPIGEMMDLFETFMDRWAAGQAQTADMIGAIVGRELTADDVEPLTWALIERGRNTSGAEYLSAVSQHQLATRIFAGLYEDGGFDLILTPTLGDIPQPLGTFDDSGPDPMVAIEKARQFAGFTGLFNATGQPAISLPLAESVEGLPIGIQLVAPIWREDVLIRIAAQLEAAHPWADRRPAVFAEDQ
ncbi:MAG: amidase [Thermoleophilia bacterium]|nr:amidase [Thermoleophilia bacterium]